MSEIWIVVGALLIVTIGVIGTNHLKADCKEKGGVLLKSGFTYECVKGEIIK